MTVRITIKDADTGHAIAMDIEESTLMEEIIESSAAFWEKDPGAWVLRVGDRVLRGNATFGESLVAPGDTLELIPDPEGG